MQARQVAAKITIEAKDVSADLAPYLIALSYTDNAHGKTDDISITLHDRDGVWKSKWMPEKGDKVKLEISPIGFQFGGKSDPILVCGSFQIDEVTITGYPSTIEIKGVSIPLDGNLRREKRSKTWAKTTLKQVASDIVKASSLSLSFFE